MAETPDQNAAFPTTEPQQAAPSKAGAEKADEAATGQAESAHLWDPTPRPGSAADLIERALEYRWNWDWEREKACLRQAADSYSGTKDGARALIELARTHYRQGEDAEADEALSRAVAERPDPEVQSFAEVMRALCLATRAKDFAAAESLLRSAAASWRGSELGGWAALELGDLYRDYIEFGQLHWDQVIDDACASAIANYRAAAEAYAGTLIAEEAEVAIGECLDWSAVDHLEAAEVFRKALEHVRSDRIRVRAIVGLGISLAWAGEDSESFSILTEFVEQHPAHPSVPLARICRSVAASHLGHWDVAVADAEALLASPMGQNGHQWVYQARCMLAEDAFRRGDFETAEAYFSQSLADACDADSRAFSLASIGRCNEERGAHARAVKYFLQAADVGPAVTGRAQYLYQAALVAQAADETSVHEVSSALPASPLSACPSVEAIAWLAVAYGRAGDSAWLGHRPTGPQDWRRVAQGIEQHLGAEIPDSPWVRLAAARAHLEAQAPDKAIASLEVLLNRWPESPDAKEAGIRLAPLLTHAGRTSEAADLCRWLLRQYPPAALEASARRELARAGLCRGEEHGEALRDYYQAIAADPSSELAQQAVRAMADVVADCLGPDTAAQLLHWLRDTYSNSAAAAMADYELAQLDSKHRLDVWQAGQYLAVIEQYPGSQAAALAASTLRERATELAESLAGLAGRGKHDDFVAHFASLAPYLDSLDSQTFSQALTALVSSAAVSTLLAEQAQPAIAVLLCAPSCRDDPDKMALLYEAQGNLAARTGSTEMALQSWQRLLDDYPASESAAHAALQVGDHYLAVGKPEEAIRAYQHARRALQHLSPEQRASAMVGVGLALEALGRWDEAAYEYRAAIGLAPDSQAAHQAAQALERLESPR